MIDDFKLSIEEQIIIACLGDITIGEKADHIRKLYAPECDETLWQSAVLNRVEPIVGHALMDAWGVDNIPARWVNIHQKNCDRISAYLSELDDVAAELQQRGIPLVALKNGGIARGIYPCLGCCPMGDLDVLVDKGDFRRAHDILQEHGFEFNFRSPLEKVNLNYAEQSGGAEYYKTLENVGRLWFELQWRPVAGRWIRPDQEPSAEELIANSLCITGTMVRLLMPDDNLLQVALHTAKHSYIRAPGIRLHIDVDRIVRRQLINWDRFLLHVRALAVKTPVYYSLAIPKGLFNTPIPDHVLDFLRPPAWKEQMTTKWLKRAGFFNPDEKKFGRLGYMLFTVFLYDDLKGLWQAIFPDSAWMSERYSVTSHWILPIYYLKRLSDLAFRRMNT